MRNTAWRHMHGWFIAAIIFFYPLINLWPYLVPVNGWYLGIGNDFRGLYAGYKFYLLDHLSHLTIPLWSPSEAAGFPFFSSPFTQTFYPLNIPLTVFYRLFGGYSTLDHQWFTLLGLSVFALGLYAWLRALGISQRAALVSALVMPLSLKLTEMIRFPNAVHTTAWYPWILWGMTRLFTCRSRRQTILYGLLLFAFVVCLLTGGYPYIAYYSLFLFGPYLIILLIPGLRRALIRLDRADWQRALATLALSGLAALALCSPYLIKMAELMRETTDRAGGSFQFSNFTVFTFTDSLGALFLPPASQTEGWYFFGAAGVFILVMYFASTQRSAAAVLGASTGSPSTGSGGEMPPGEREDARPPSLTTTAVFIVWYLIISYITYGKDSLLFAILWEYLPFFSVLRYWGRLNVVLIPVLAWALALAYPWFENIALKTRANPRTRPCKLIITLCAAFGLGLAFQVYATVNRLFDEYWRLYVAGGGGPQSALDYFARFFGTSLALTPEQTSTLYCTLFIIFHIIAFVIILALLLFPLPKSRKTANGFLVGFVLFSTLNMQILGPWTWSRGREPYKPRYQLNIQRDRVNRVSLGVPRSDVLETSIAHGAGFNVGVFENWYYERYNKFRARAQAEPEAMQQLLGVRDGTRLYFSTRIDYPTLQGFLDDALRYSDFVEVKSYDGDTLTLKVKSPAEGYLSFIDNWDKDWSARVDGKEVPIDLLFDTFKAVRLTGGDHTVVFAYRPALFP